MKPIPTAEEFLKNKFKQIYAKRPEGLSSKISESRYLDLYVTGRIDGREQNYPEMMIEFAKLHVEAALKEVSEQVEADLEPMGWLAEQHLSSPLIEGEDYAIGVCKNSILEAYSLSKIL